MNREQQQPKRLARTSPRWGSHRFSTWSTPPLMRTRNSGLREGKNNDEIITHNIINKKMNINSENIT
jgi:hypothetical protein